MNCFIKHIVTTFSIFFSLYGFSQQFQATVSKKKISDQQTIEYSIYSANIEGEIEPPSFKNFDVVGGPNTKRHMQILNGRTTTVNGYSYILRPKKTGILSIAPSSVVFKGKTYKSESFSIEVYRDEEARKNNFARISLSRNTLYPGQDLIATFKIYTREQFENYQVIDPISFDGFYVKQLEFKQNEISKETINGKEYYVIEVDKAKLTPIKTGKLSLKPLKVKTQTIVRKNNGRGGFFSSFSAERHTYDLQTNGLTVNVKDFPKGKPDSFNGAIGNFKLSSNLTSNQTMANNAINFIITIKGKGNLPLVELPEINFPPSFEVYDPEIKQSNNTKTWSYLLIPKKEGEYQIPENLFSYLDPRSNSYKTLSIKSEKITVTIDPNAATTSEQFNHIQANQNAENTTLKLKEIASFTSSFSKQTSIFFGSFLHLLILLGILFLSAITLIFFKRQKAIQSDLIGLKKKGANKVAKRRLKKASVALNSNDNNIFYEELFNAFYGYIEDKFNLDKESLSKEIISQTLLKQNISPSVTSQFIETINACEMARFSPSSQENKEELYHKSVELISKIEAKA